MRLAVRRPEPNSNASHACDRTNGRRLCRRQCCNQDIRTPATTTLCTLHRRKSLRTCGSTCTRMVSEIVYFFVCLFVLLRIYCPVRCGVVYSDSEIIICFRFLFALLYPVGGIARFKVYGEITFNPHDRHSVAYKDVFSMQNGAKCLQYSNAHYGHPRNLTKPGSAVNMGDGWETHVSRPDISLAPFYPPPLHRSKCIKFRLFSLILLTYSVVWIVHWSSKSTQKVIRWPRAKNGQFSNWLQPHVWCTSRSTHITSLAITRTPSKSKGCTIHSRASIHWSIR